MKIILNSAGYGEESPLKEENRRMILTAFSLWLPLAEAISAKKDRLSAVLMNTGSYAQGFSVG